MALAVGRTLSKAVEDSRAICEDENSLMSLACKTAEKKPFSLMWTGLQTDAASMLAAWKMGKVVAANFQLFA